MEGRLDCGQRMSDDPNRPGRGLAFVHGTSAVGIPNGPDRAFGIGRQADREMPPANEADGIDS